MVGGSPLTLIRTEETASRASREEEKITIFSLEAMSELITLLTKRILGVRN